MICSFWLVTCLAKAGQVERAEALFEQHIGLIVAVDRAREAAT